MNHSIEELFQYSDDLIAEKNEKVRKDLAKEIKKIENDLEKRNTIFSGQWYSKRIEVNLNAFEKFIQFRVKSDLKNFLLPKTKPIYESPLKTPSSNLTIFYFKIGQLVELDHKKDETKNIAQFLDQFETSF